MKKYILTLNGKIWSERRGEFKWATGYEVLEECWVPMEFKTREKARKQIAIMERVNLEVQGIEIRLIWL